MTSTTCEIQWLIYLIRDINVVFHHLALLFYDNASAMHIAQNSVFHERTKHSEIDCHVVHEKLEKGLIKLLPVSSQEQTANIFTKPLEPAVFNQLLPKLGIHNIYSLA
jgi:hypothetical protein